MINKGKIIKNIANYITIVRIVISLAMIFFDAISITFMVLYLIASLTDVIDGLVARKMKIQSRLGSKLDTIADFIFFIVCIISIYPLLNIYIWQLIIIIVIASIKIINIISNYLITHSLIVDVHSSLNKITGMLLFFLPISINLNIDKYYIYLIIVLALVASVDEMLKVIKQYKSIDNKMI